MHTHADEGIGTAARGVADRASTLVRLELELAAIELRAKAKPLAAGAGLGVGAAVLALFALGFGLAAAAAALALVVPVWLALLIVCAVLLVGTLALGFGARASVRAGGSPVPEHAIREARLTADALKGSNGRP